MRTLPPKSLAISLRQRPLFPDGTALRLLVAGAGFLALTSCGSNNLTTTDTQGTIAVGAVSSGADLDRDGYTVAVNNGHPDIIGILDTILITDIQPGTYTLQLAGLAPNCTVPEGTNPQTTTVVAADTVQINFEIACEAVLPPGDGGGGNL